MKKECICADDDENPFSGFSICGFPCPEHPPSKEDIAEVAAIMAAIRKVHMNRPKP